MNHHWLEQLPTWIPLYWNQLFPKSLQYFLICSGISFFSSAICSFLGLHVFISRYFILAIILYFITCNILLCFGVPFLQERFAKHLQSEEPPLQTVYQFITWNQILKWITQQTIHLPLTGFYSPILLFYFYIVRQFQLESKPTDEPYTFISDLLQWLALFLWFIFCLECKRYISTLRGVAQFIINKDFVNSVSISFMFPLLFHSIHYLAMILLSLLWFQVFDTWFCIIHTIMFWLIYPMLSAVVETMIMKNMVQNESFTFLLLLWLRSAVSDIWLCFLFLNNQFVLVQNQDVSSNYAILYCILFVILQDSILKHLVMKDCIIPIFSQGMQQSMEQNTYHLVSSAPSMNHMDQELFGIPSQEAATEEFPLIATENEEHTFDDVFPAHDAKDENSFI